jgi:Zn finger protein HypA/HybF involved in hydrogenase expression
MENEYRCIDCGKPISKKEWDEQDGTCDECLSDFLDLNIEEKEEEEDCEVVGDGSD